VFLLARQVRLKLYLDKSFFGKNGYRKVFDRIHNLQQTSNLQLLMIRYPYQDQPIGLELTIHTGNS